MTVAELMELLEQYNGGMEVRMMCQPNWPFEYSLAGIVCKGEIDGSVEMEEDADGVIGIESDVLYLLEGSQLGYGSKAAWDMR